MILRFALDLPLHMRSDQVLMENRKVKNVSLLLNLKKNSMEINEPYVHTMLRQDLVQFAS